MPARCVVFDVDDTLYLERDFVRGGFVAAEGEVDLAARTGFADRCWRLFADGRRGDIFDAAFAEAGIEPTPALVAKLVTAYRLHVPDIALLADSEAALGIASRAGTVSIVTDGPVATQSAKVTALGLERWASHMLFTDGWGVEYRKPHGRAFRTVMDLTGIVPEACVYVADNPVKDFVAPHALGWRTVRVRRPESLNVHLASGSDVDIEVSDLTGFGDILATLA